MLVCHPERGRMPESKDPDNAAAATLRKGLFLPRQRRESLATGHAVGKRANTTQARQRGKNHSSIPILNPL